MWATWREFLGENRSRLLLSSRRSTYLVEHASRGHKKHILSERKPRVQECSGIDRRDLRDADPTRFVFSMVRTDELAMSARRIW